MNSTLIEWCTKSFNAVVGCTFNCAYCYAKKLNNRFKWIPNWNEPKFYPERLKQLNMKKPQNIFMNSMSDIADWKEGWVHQIAIAIKENPQHNYMFLTKRIDVVRNNVPKFHHILGCPNVWIGVSINTNKDVDDRIYDLQDLGHFKCKLFLSIEPIHEKIKSLNHYCHIDWIIVGAETGNRKAKPVPTLDWVKHIELDTIKHKIPLFYKDSMKIMQENRQLIREFPKELEVNGKRS